MKVGAKRGRAAMRATGLAWKQIYKWLFDYDQDQKLQKAISANTDKIFLVTRHVGYKAPPYLFRDGRPIWKIEKVPRN